MGSYDTPTQNCPYCNAECEADWVDNGLGMVQCGPYHCYECGASEIGPEINDWRELILKDKSKLPWKYDVIWKEGNPFNENEKKNGWYDPNKQKTISPYANTIGGKLVNHKVAEIANKLGLLDEKNI